MCVLLALHESSSPRAQAHPDRDGSTALHLAATFGHAAVCVPLLAAGAEKEAKDAGGWTPLHRAAQNGKVEVCGNLLAAGADTDGQDNSSGSTPLHAAAEGGHA